MPTVSTERCPSKPNLNDPSARRAWRAYAAAALQGLLTRDAILPASHIWPKWADESTRLAADIADRMLREEYARR